MISPCGLASELLGPQDGLATDWLSRLGTLWDWRDRQHRGPARVTVWDWPWCPMCSVDPSTSVYIAVSRPMVTLSTWSRTATVNVRPGRELGSRGAKCTVPSATAAVLLLAANTSSNDFPRLLFPMARDFQAPRSFLRIGDRLTFRNGILVLSVTAAVIYAVFHGNTVALIPLYAVGVFLAFTMSQAGFNAIGRTLSA